MGRAVWLALQGGAMPAPHPHSRNMNTIMIVLTVVLDVA
jgi:hypothetical protein